MDLDLLLLLLLNKSNWTKEKCHEEAKKYKTRLSFYKGSKSAYDVADINGWLDEICSHMHMITLNEICSYMIDDRTLNEIGSYYDRYDR